MARLAASRSAFEVVNTLNVTYLMARLAASRSAFEAVNTLNVTCLMARLAASHSAFEVMNKTFDIVFIYVFLRVRVELYETAWA